MALTPEESWKVGFLAKCAEERLTPEQILERAQSLLKEGGVFGDVVGGIGNMAFNAGALGLAGSAALGAGTGYTLAKMREKPLDTKEIQKQELIAAYNTFADRMRQQSASRRTRPVATARFS